MTWWCGELQQASTAGQMSILDATLEFLIGKEKHTTLVSYRHPLLFLVPLPAPCTWRGAPVYGG